MHGIELPRLAAAAAEGIDFLHRLAVIDMNLLVGAVGDVHEFLLRIAREGDFPGGAVALGVRLDRILLHEGAIGLEDLDAVIGAVADIDQPVIRRLGAMHRIAELR